MPRDSGTGVATPPSGTTLVANTDIQSAPLNSIHSDIYAIFNAPIPAGLLPSLSFLPLAGGTLTGPVTLAADATASLNPVTLQQYTTGLAGKAATAHTHTSTDITNFNAAADARIALTVINTLADVAVTSVAVGDTLKWNGTNFVNTPANSFTEIDLGFWAQNVTLSAAHGISTPIANVEFWYKCITADIGYVPNQYVPLISASLNAATLLVPFFDATNVGVVCRQNQTLSLLSTVTRLDAAPNLARWKVIARIFA